MVELKKIDGIFAALFVKYKRNLLNFSIKKFWSHIFIRILYFETGNDKNIYNEKFKEFNYKKNNNFPNT